jgi:hypothetical protein
MTVDHPTFGTMCEICFSTLTVERCAVDTAGVKWDVCAGDCARQAGIVELPHGLCGNRQDHDPHPVHGSTVGDFFCTARQEDRLPYAAERRRDGR